MAEGELNNNNLSHIFLMVEEQRVAQEGLGLAVGRCLKLFYGNDGVVRPWDPERI